MLALCVLPKGGSQSPSGNWVLLEHSLADTFDILLQNTVITWMEDVLLYQYVKIALVSFMYSKTMGIKWG